MFVEVQILIKNCALFLNFLTIFSSELVLLSFFNIIAPKVVIIIITVRTFIKLFCDS